MKTTIVLGLGFGDEGKGLTTSFLSGNSNKSLVVRFSGGHQAGHTVVKDNFRHVFSNFGSGTLNNADTYWSEYCTFYPKAVLNEYDHLKDFNPKLFVHPLCPVTTPFDRLYNQQTETENNHGSCGVGFGATIQRREKYFKLYVQDLFFESVYKEKIKNIANLYYKNFLTEDSGKIFNQFVEEIERVKEIISTSINFKKYDHIIFEGSQGILLDMDFGFFPNVTRANTTSKNALEIIAKNNLTYPEIYYVTRSYQTRHGNGFMTNEEIEVPLINNGKETNVFNTWQGKFRIGSLDIDLLNYALQCDNHFSARLNKNLVISCLDQTGGIFPATQNGQLAYYDQFSVTERLKTTFGDVFTSHSDESEKLEKLTFAKNHQH